MKIIILGAGQVGSSVAANLVSEANDITIVDIDPKLLQSLSERYDLQAVLGVASHPLPNLELELGGGGLVPLPFIQCIE